jgi:hypothetical protein
MKPRLLTRVREESLSGKPKTCLIITCSSSIYEEGGTLSTLDLVKEQKPKMNKEQSL